MVAPGTAVSIQAGSFESAPSWLTYSGGSLSGNAELPSGFRRIISTSSGGVRQENTVTVDPVALPADTRSPWRCAVYAPNGSYIVMNGLGGIPTVGTPVVRLSDNAPSKAVVRIPVGRGADNIRASTFAKWSDGHSEMVKRGMELTVEYRDADSSTLTLVFRGRIFQLSSGETVEITAYDRLMDLAQFSDQYQPGLGETQWHLSSSRSGDGSPFIYQMDSEVGTITGAIEYDAIKFDSLASRTNNRISYTKLIDTYTFVHAIPYYGTTALNAGDRITQVRTVFGYETSNPGQGTATVNVIFRLYRNMSLVAQKTYTFTQSAASSGTVTAIADVDWRLEGPASEYRIGATATYSTTYGTLIAWWRGGNANYSDYRYIYNGNWEESGNVVPEISVNAERVGASLNPSLLTASGSTVRINSGSLSPPSAGGTLSVDNAGYALRVQYYPVGGVDIRSLVETLIRNAGLNPDADYINMGQLTYYTTSTYDYLTCVHELIRASNLGLCDSVASPGTVRVMPRHTISENPGRTVTTSPEGNGEPIVVSHDLTAHWMAEKATVAYLTGGMQGTMSSYPIALESDDGLMPNSLTNALGPLRQVITDTSMGSHDMMAKAAGGKMVQLHTNVFEGTVTLAGYRLSAWDIHGSGEGGMPIGIDIPEYDAQGTAVPTEMEIRDGTTVLKLNNIRTADRSEVANSMGLTADSVSNGSSQLPSAVFVFSRIDPRFGKYTLSSVTSVSIVDSAGTVMATQSNTQFIKTASDNAGYSHVCALFVPTTGVNHAPRGIASIRFVMGGQTFTSTVTNPKEATAGQGVHIDVRFGKP